MSNTKQIGLWTTTSLVVGNMIASGLFMLPATLAVYGGISLIGWLISGAGAICLALVYSWLSKLKPVATGGPYAYTHEGMGDFPAFLVAWGYWISIWCTNAAIAVAFVSYLTAFIPALGNNPLLSVGTGLAAIWLLGDAVSAAGRAGRIWCFPASGLDRYRTQLAALERAGLGSRPHMVRPSATVAPFQQSGDLPDDIG